MTSREVRDLLIGESAWTVPWTVILNGKGAWFLHADYAVRSDATARCCVKVTRTADGMEADLSGAPFYWHSAPLWDDPPASVLLLPCTVIARDETQRGGE